MNKLNNQEDTTRQALNAQLEGFAALQGRVNTLSKDLGRPLTKQEQLSLIASDEDCEKGD